MPVSKWTRKSKYHLENSDGHKICWDDSKDHVLLWVGDNSYKFPNVTRAVEVYDSCKGKKEKGQSIAEWWADYDNYLEKNSE